MNLFSPDEDQGELTFIELNLPDAEIKFYETFLSLSERDYLYKNLLAEINWQQDKIRVFNKEYFTPRLSAWYADENLNYSYSGVLLKPNPWTASLLLLRDKLNKLLGHNFNSVLVNLYRTGLDSMGWHQDNEKELGKNPIIASLSLGQSRVFQLKHIKNKALGTKTIELTNGSLLLMQGSTQHYWKHQVPKTNKSISPRINLTFRTIKR
jgi:alkylated DNA repair dioxygenase AlkB